MTGEYVIIILLSYVLYPVILFNLFNIIRNKLSKKHTLAILQFVILPIAIFITSHITSATEFFIKIIEYVTPFMLCAYFITFMFLIIRFIRNKQKA